MSKKKEIQIIKCIFCDKGHKGYLVGDRGADYKYRFEVEDGHGGVTFLTYGDFSIEN